MESKKLKILAIETSCDETAVAVLDAADGGFTVLSNVVSSQIAMHEQFGGVVPALAAREHAANIGAVCDAALTQAAITDPARQIGLIAVTNGPGLGPALLVGLTFARTLAWKWSVPLVGVNHLDGHIHSNWLTGQATTDITLPALNLIVSGGHTELVLMRDHGMYEILGETQDDAVGEAFDKVARLLDLPYPGGPRVSALAATGNPSVYPLPRPMLGSPNLHFSYSGLKTAVLYLIRDLTNGSRPLADAEKADIAASFEDAAVDVLIQKTRRAIEATGVQTVLLSGGVSANKLLRQRLTDLAADIGVRCFIPDLAFTGDNAAMIGVAGYYAYRSLPAGSVPPVTMDANLRLDAGCIQPVPEAQ
jgi:N6-L-threonylcarbamoyladenine synthase